MYCVKCGVKLQTGVKECPLCQTPVMIEENIEAIHQKYSELYPKDKTHERYTILGVLTAFLTCIAIVCLCINLNVEVHNFWAGYAMLGLFTFYILFIFPFWFKKYYYYIFLPVDLAVIEGYLLYICLKSGGKWFLSFAFPLIAIVFVIFFAMLILYKNIKKGRIFVTGGSLIVIGCSCMLLELFQAITFNTPMFTWCLYAVSAFSAFGLFFLIAGCIPSLRAFIERKFFI